MVRVTLNISDISGSALLTLDFSAPNISEAVSKLFKFLKSYKMVQTPEATALGLSTDTESEPSEATDIGVSLRSMGTS